MTKQTFNRDPYFDDYSADRGFLKVLFKPGVPVQTRELNVAQSIMLGQVEFLSNHIFKNGSKVSNARSVLGEYQYVRLRDLTPDTGVSVNVEQFSEGMVVKGEVSGITARLVQSVNAENGDPATLYVVYMTTAIDGETTAFIPGENLQFSDSLGVTVYRATVRCPSCAGSVEGGEVHPTGLGHIFTIDEGVFYFEGMFIQNLRQSLIVSKYSRPLGQDPQPFAGCKIGFDFVQSIVTAEDDSSLFDNALGYPNRSAPGADRYKVELILNKRSYDAEDGTEFLLLSKFSSRYVTEYQRTDSDYADLMDNIAKRTYETNGNYTIRPFKLSFYEHKKQNKADPKGWDINGSEENIVALVSPSVAYVKGYRAETIADTPLLMKKARDTAKQQSFVTRFDDRAFVTLKPLTDVVWPGAAADASIIGGNVVNLHEQANGAGPVIGTCRFNDFEKISGQNTGHTAVYKYTIIDLAFTVANKTLANVKSFQNVDTGFRADTVNSVDSGTFEVQNANRNDLVFRIQKSNIKTLRDSDNNLNGSTSIVVRKKLKATLDSNGGFVFNSATNEFFESLSGRTVAFTTNSSNVTKTFDLNSNIFAITPTSISVNLGSSEVGKTLTAFVDVLKTNQKEKKKTLVTQTYTTSVAPATVIGSTILLGKADALDLTKIELYDHSDSANPVLISDVTNSYALQSGSTNWFYGESSIKLKASLGVSVTNDYRLHVTFRYFEHSGSEGFFTVDSYSDVINDPSNSLSYKDIPVYMSSTGEAIPLISAFDFRAIRITGQTPTGNVPANNSTAIFDCEYYLPRADIIQISKDGLIYPKYGVPSDAPALPKPDADSMVLYHVFLNAYTYSMNDVSNRFIENKRFTMRDIGRLEDRIENVEYYTTLSLLEQQTAALSIKDENGLDRFKNGMVVDNFSDFQAADLGNVEFKCSMDRTRRELRPRFKASNVKMVANKELSEGVQWQGGIATLPYTSEVQSENPYATKHISINPYFVYNKKGTVVLSPNVDTWADETRLPEVVTTIDTGTEAIRKIADAAGLLGTEWGSWVNQNSTVIASSSTNFSGVGNTLRSQTRDGIIITQEFDVIQSEGVVTNETISTTSSRTGKKKDVEGEAQGYTIEDIVKDVQIIPYVRSRPVEFYASNLRPNTRIYAYFDGEDVSEFIRDIRTTLNADNAASMLAQIAYGSPCFTSDDGSFVGEFLIPEGRFFTGKSEFKLSDDSTGSGDPDMETTSATATYFSGGLDVTKQDSTLNLITPLLNESQVSETRQTTSSRATVNVTSSAVIGSTTVVSVDPVAQQFFVDEDQMLTGIDLYFRSIDQTSDVIWFEIRTMVNGYPSNAALLRREFKPSQLVASADSTVPNHIEFFTPLFVEGGQNYCYVVGGASINTRIWVAKLGDEVVDMPGKIVETQPTVGSSFRSQNGVTWNAEQFETIKYKMYRARFTGDAFKVVMQNQFEDVGAYVLPMNPIETQSGSDAVRIYWPNHGFTESDRVSLSLFENQPLRVKAIDLPPQIGQTFHTVTGSGTIKAIEKNGNVADEYMVTLEKTSGVFLANQGYTADAMTKAPRDLILLSNIGNTAPISVTLNVAYGTVMENSSWGEYLNGLVNGLPVEELNKEHTVKDVDSPDSFIIQTTVPATVTGRSGGAAIRSFQFNTKFETVNLSGSYIAYNSIEEWEIVGAGHGAVGSPFESENYTELAPVSIQPGKDYKLEKPYKLASPTNETRVFGTTGQKSIKVTANFRTRNPLLSPVVDTSTFSTIAVSNEVGWIEATDYNVAPNAANRLVPETHPLNGIEPHKYVSVNVRLANPASDLFIYFDYYKDYNADFDVYVKKVPVYEAQNIDLIPWMKVNIDSKRNSSSRTDTTEMKIQCSEQVSGWNDTSGDPIPMTIFKVKIVGRTKNSAKPPLFEKFRAIAVT